MATWKIVLIVVAVAAHIAAFAIWILKEYLFTGPSKAQRRRAVIGPQLVKHLLNKGFMVGEGDSRLWAFEADEKLDQRLENLTDEDLLRIYLERGLAGQLGARKVLLRTPHDSSKPKFLEMFLYWRRRETEQRIELALETDKPICEPNYRRSSSDVALAAFDTQNPTFNKFFKKRWGSKFIADRLSQAGQSLAFVAEFAARWGKHVESVEATDSIEVKFSDRVLTDADDPIQTLESLIEDIDRLAVAIETSVDPSFVMEPVDGEQATGPRYVAIKTLTKCPRCKAVLPLNGPILNVHCDDCQADLTLKAEFWDEMLSMPYTDYLKESGSLTVNFEDEMQWQAARPKCEECKEPLLVDEIAVGTDDDARCPSCGHANPTYPAPEWLRELVPKIEQIYRAERDKPDATAAAHDAVVAPDAPVPIVLSCPECNGPIKATAASDRTVPCEYCRVEVFLPDAVWKRLHPKRIAEVWYVRYEAPRQLS